MDDSSNKRLAEPHLFLSMEPAGRREVLFARSAVITSFVMFLAAVPFATRPLTEYAAFIPAYESALVICDLITAALLFGQYMVTRTRALFVLASGYLFTALIAFAHALTFPGVFSPTGLLGAGPQSTIRLYLVWHGGFLPFVLAYALLKNRRREGVRAFLPGSFQRRRAGVAVMLGVAGMCLTACAVTLLATAEHEFLPVLIVGQRYTFAFTVAISTCWTLSFLCLFLLWKRRPHTILDAWLVVVMSAWIFEIALSAIVSESRYDLGWYAGRIYGVVVAGSLLVMLLLESSTHYARLAQMSVALSDANVALERLSLRDGLTGLFNRRYFDSYLTDQTAVARRYGRTLCLVLFDVDSFKAYNDHYGHQAGDECLRLIARALQSSCRRTADVAARYGGEEFALILPDTTLSGAIHVAEIARESVTQLNLPHEHSPAAAHISISGGVAVSSPLGSAGATPSSLIGAADLALYQAKHSGRNRIASIASTAGCEVEYAPDEPVAAPRAHSAA